MAYPNLAVFFETSHKYHGGKSVWVKDSNGESRKNVLLGCTIANPPKGFGHLYAAQLFQFTPGESGYIFRSFAVKTASASNATSIVITGDGYSDIPEVGNVLIKAGSSATEVGTVATITDVVYDAANEKFTCTLSAAIGALEVGDILVEGLKLTANEADFVVGKTAASAPATAATGDKYLNTTDGKIYTATAADTWGTGAAVSSGKYVFDSSTSKAYTLVSTTMTEVVVGTPLVKNPNTFVEADRDLIPTDGSYGFDNVNYQISTIYDKEAWIARMQPLPPYVLAKNRSYIDGIFWI